MFAVIDATVNGKRPELGGWGGVALRRRRQAKDSKTATKSRRVSTAVKKGGEAQQIKFVGEGIR